METRFRSIQTSRSGFTLIELSIVLVIIGLIVGGVLVGRDMIDAAQTRALIAQLEKYKTSVNAFRLKYGSLPGDMSPAKACGGACTGGDPADTGFGFAARAGGSRHGDENGRIDYCTTVVDRSEIGCENTLFWRDLSEAQMLDFSLIAATDAQLPNLTEADTYRYLPAAKGADGAVIAVEAQTDPDHYLGVGNFLIVTGSRGTNGQSQLSIKEILSPAKAFSIDQKLDDGYPASGSIQGWSATGLFNFFAFTTTQHTCIPFVGAGGTFVYNLDGRGDRDKPLCLLFTPL